MRWIKLWTTEDDIDCFNYGVWCKLLKLSGRPDNPTEYGYIGVNKNIGYTDEQLAELLVTSLSEWQKSKQYFLEKDKRITIDKKNIIQILNWKHYQSDYVRVIEFRKRFKQNETANETANDNAQEVRIKNKNKEVRIKNKENTLVIAEKKTSAHTNPNIKIFTDVFCKDYQTQFNQKYHYTGKDAKLIQRLLQTYDLSTLEKLLQEFFNSQDEFIVKAGYTIGVFSSCINKLISGKTSDKFSGLKEWARIKEKQRQEVKNVTN